MTRWNFLQVRRRRRPFLDPYFDRVFCYHDDTDDNAGGHLVEVDKAILTHISGQWRGEGRIRRRRRLTGLYFGANAPTRSPVKRVFALTGDDPLRKQRGRHASS